jgi:hypothetical protein
MPPQESVKSNKFHWLFAVVPALFLLVVGIVAIALVPKTAPKTSTSDNNTTASVQSTKGVAMVPRTVETPKFAELFTDAPSLGGLVTWTGDWGELSKPNSGAKVLMAAADQYNFTPIVMVTLHSNSSPSKLLRPLTPELIDQYAKDAADFVKQNPLSYFGMGVEVNNLKKDDPSGYADFVKLFNKAADAIKLESPSTKVFTVFQLERTKGLNGGLFGGANDTNANTWSLSDDFSKADVIGFTTYPYLIYKTPDQVPADYYSEISSHVSKPVIFTEVGWPSGLEAVGWDSSIALQAKFVDTFFALTKSLDPQVVIWPFAYDPPTNHPFSSIGLAEVSGQHKPAWDRWVAN